MIAGELEGMCSSEEDFNLIDNRYNTKLKYTTGKLHYHQLQTVITI